MSHSDSIQSNITIKDLAVLVSIGVSEQEKSESQSLSISLQYNISPRALEEAQKDDISQIVCYDDLCSKITTFCSNSRYSLIEKLGYELHQYLHLQCNIDILDLTITKKPPIANLDGAITFQISSKR